jgi:high-affinity nickel permease
VHRQQTRSLVHGKTSIRTCLYVKVGHSRVLFIKIIMIARNCRAGTAQRMMLFTSADKLHTHPSICGFAGQAKPCFRLNLP